VKRYFPQVGLIEPWLWLIKSAHPSISIVYGRVADQLAEASHPRAGRSSEEMDSRVSARPRRNDRKTVLSTNVLEVKSLAFFTQILVSLIDEEENKLLQRWPKTVRNTFYA
jgi:hypothetical protein